MTNPGRTEWQNLYAQMTIMVLRAGLKDARSELSERLNVKDRII
jgi:hypothetical protein